jgi:Zn-dependent M16 (insulinase) family peptidase
MKNLRSLSAETIRQYHRDFYRPENLCLIITGKVDHAHLLATLDKFEEKIVAKGPLPSHSRPWVASPPLKPITKSIETVVDFPDDDESIGSVYIAWRGPKYSEHLELAALDVLSTYLTESAVALLEKEVSLN